MPNLSYAAYTGNGTQTDYTLPFPYIDRADVVATVNTVSVPFTFLNASAVRLTTAPATGTTVQVRRKSNKASVPVNFSDGSVLLEKDLDTLAQFALYSVQEQDDATQDALVVIGQPNFQAITDQITANKNSAAASATSATASATSATSSQGAATASQAAAASSASGAATSATNATTSATASGNSATASANSATVSANSAAAAALSYDEFDDRYLGSKAAAPTLDNDGNALLTGALYFNSTSGVLNVRTAGALWSPAVIASSSFIAGLLDDASAVDARVTLGAAVSGANTDITSLGNNTSTIYTTAGAATAYVITPSPVYTAYAAGMSFVVNFNAASGVSPTFAINGIATPPQLVKGNADGTYSNIAAGDIPINQRSRVTLISATQALVERGSTAVSSSYTSGNQTWVAAGTLTLAHGLTKAPKITTYKLVNLTAENGYSVGDVVIIPPMWSRADTSPVGFTPRVDATNIVIAFNNTSTHGLMPKTGGAIINTLFANWALQIEAFA